LVFVDPPAAVGCAYAAVDDEDGVEVPQRMSLRSSLPRWGRKESPIFTAFAVGQDPSGPVDGSSGPNFRVEQMWDEAEKRVRAPEVSCTTAYTSNRADVTVIG
jgi:hypothetical protein